MKYETVLVVFKDGKYTLSAKSDDGSRVYVDGKQVVDNDGRHKAQEKSGDVDLKAGEHALVVTRFQGIGEKDVALKWQGPDFKKEDIGQEVLGDPSGRPMLPVKDAAFVVDEEKAAAGKKLFASAGCANCHVGVVEGAAGQVAKGLLELKPNAAQGCLAEQVGKGLPRYDLSADQRKTIATALADAAGLKAKLGPADQVLRLMAAMNCYACHQRDELGGPAEDRDSFFGLNEAQDLGDEGRLPPRLTGVGGKLRPEAIGQIVFEGKLHVRPFMSTRMPRFNKEKLGGLVEALVKLDAPAAGEPVPATPADTAVKDGVLLVGTRGLGCVNCHGVAGVKGIGSPSPDLSFVRERLRPEWYHRLMLNPAEVNPGTRMPQFWPDGDVAFKQMADGTVEGQISAIWAYVQQGQKMTLPIGLSGDARDELVPLAEPIVLRAFMNGVGPRAVLVGYPEMVNLAFDANVVRLAKAWHGRFFDAKSIWEGRGGASAPPLGEDVIDLPAGPAIAHLASAEAAWPVPKVDERNVGGKFKGYVLDKLGRPTFRYELGEIVIQEQPSPIKVDKRQGISRQFTLTSASDAKGLYVLAAAGKKIESTGEGVWVIDDHIFVRVTGAGTPVVREGAGGKQLVAPVVIENGKGNFVVEMTW